ncbi:unnamed protein product [Protopolystoma xenopodis]|uniref:Kinesin-like protein n=1 Tax=Protopolystoma xenopodis TaxID=117903 RepID=A0A448WTU0_9PLAT|nr:unnamed protein product [Protopolystoma xenopodis]
MIKPDKSESVKVVIRCRPMNKKESDAGYHRCVFLDVPKGMIELKNPTSKANDVNRHFTFDAQLDLYEETFRDLIQSVLEGFNGTIFAYGQTGTGKTFTIQGLKDDLELRGVIPNSFQHIFGHIANSKDAQYLVRSSYMEIYKEELRDLLNKDTTKSLEIKEKPDSGIYVKLFFALGFIICTYKKHKRNRKSYEYWLSKSLCWVGSCLSTWSPMKNFPSDSATNMNEHSSRSHAIFIITIESSEKGDDGKNHIHVGKLNLVDLAGSERQSKTQAEVRKYF